MRQPSGYDPMVLKALSGTLARLPQATLRSRFFFWNMFGNIGPLVIALFVVPYVYGHASREYVGFLTLIWAAIGYTGIFDFGISRALYFYAAAGKTRQSADLEGAILKSVVIAIVASVVVNAVVYAFIDRISYSMSLDNSDKVTALLILTGTLPIYIISNMVRASLEGSELFREAGLFKFGSYASLFLCPALLIFHGDQQLAHVCVLYAATRLAAGLYAVIKLRPHLAERRVPLLERTTIPVADILKFGGWATVSSTISPLMVYGDRFVLAYFGGASAIATYALLQEFIGKTILLSASYVATIQPRLGYLPEPEARDLYRREHRNLAVLSALVYAGCLIASPVFIAFWLDVAIGQVAFLAIVMSIGFMFNAMAQAPLAYLLARGHPRRVAFAHTVEAALYFPLLVVAAMRYGVAGAAVAGVLRQIFDYGILSWQAQRPTD